MAQGCVGNILLYDTNIFYALMHSEGRKDYIVRMSVRERECGT